LPEKSIRIISRNEESYISVYKNTPAPGQVVAKQMARIAQSFPKLKKNFYASLTERVKTMGICEERLIAAVDHCIENFRYPEPMVGEILAHDKLIKIYTYHQIIDLIFRGDKQSYYGVIKGTKLWVSRDEAERLGLTYIVK